MLCESLTMLLIVLWAKPTELGLDIVSQIALPMILGTVCIGLIVLLVQSVEDEKEVIAARQAKLALDIAHKTLPYFRNINSESLATICDIIRQDIRADAVAITDTHQVLAYVGVGREAYPIGREGLSRVTRESIRHGKIIIKNNLENPAAPADPFAAGGAAVGKRRSDRRVENLLLPRSPDHQHAEGDGGRAVANHLHADGSVPHRAPAPDGGQGRNACAAEQD